MTKYAASFPFAPEVTPMNGTDVTAIVNALRQIVQEPALMKLALQQIAQKP